MNVTPFPVSLQKTSQQRYQQLAQTLDLLIEEEKRLERVAGCADPVHQGQSWVDLAVNHSRTADLLSVLWQLQFGE